MSFSRVKGHDAVASMFDRVIRRGRLAHAYLFVGPPGVGKRLFAGELARAMLCENPPAGPLDACDRCPGCVQVGVGSHPDFYVAGRPEESLELPIDVVRELCQNFALKPARGRGKVVVLDDADDLNDESANCFLKTLEEPPPRSLLLLIGTSLDRQLDTILSRCQVVRFAPLPDEAVAELLREQGIDDPELVRRLTALGDGSPGQALALADPGLWEVRGTLLDGLTQPRPNRVEIARTWMRFIEEAGKEGAAQRGRAELVSRLLVQFFREALRHQVGCEAPFSDPRVRQRMEALAGRLGPERMLAVLDRCLQASTHIDRRVQVVLLVEALVDALGKRLR